MKPLVVCWLTALVVSDFAVGFEVGKEYVYKYKARTFTELEKQHHQHSGVAFKSEVHVQPNKDHLLIKIGHVEYGKLNDRVEKGKKGYDFDFHTNPALTEALEKPFKVLLERGLVQHVEVDSTDPNWSVNYKKGLAALFQLDFQQVNPLRTRGGEQLDEPDLGAHYFNVIEDSLYGECETMYQVSHEPSHTTPHSVTVLNVTKSINFDHCKKVPYFLFESTNYHECVECKSEEINPDRLSNVMHYNIRGDRNNYVIEKVHTESEFTHAPSTRHADMAYMHTNLTLLLLEEKDVADEIHVSDNPITHHDLHFDFPGEHGFRDAVDLKAPHYLFNFIGHSTDVEVVENEFNALITPYIDGTFEDKFEEESAPAKFDSIVKHVTTLPYDDIEKVYKAVVESPADHTEQRMKLFMEVLSAAGTNPAFLFGTRHLFEPTVPMTIALRFIHLLPLTLKEATETLYDEFNRFCESENVKAKHVLHTACYLAFSAVINENCVGKAYLNSKKIPNTVGTSCTPEIAKKYYDNIHHHVGDEHDGHELITAIKVVSNFGLKEGIQFLKKYIEEDHYPTYFRVSAIWGLHKIANSYPEAVLNEVVPVYFNLSENYEVRIAAFGVIMACHPTRSLLEAIGVGLHEEESHQVESYVGSAFTYISKSDYPCHQAIKHDLDHIMRHVDRLNIRPHFDGKHSQYWQSDGFIEEYGIGGMTRVSYVTSNDSYLPSRVFVSLHEYMEDVDVEAISLTFDQQGLDKYFDKILGPEGLFKSATSIPDLLHRREAREAASVEKELKEIDEALHIKNRHEQEVHGDLTIRMFGHEFDFFYFNESLFEKMVSGGHSDGPDVNEILKATEPKIYFQHVIAENHVFMLPSSIGFPVYLAYREPSLLYLSNKELKFQLTPPEAPTSLDVDIKAHFIYDMERIGIMAMELPFERSSAGVGLFRRTFLNVPIAKEIGVNLKTGSISLKKSPPLPTKIIHHSSHPFTFIDRYFDKTDQENAVGTLNYWKPEEMGEHHEKQHHDYFGYGLDVSAKYGKLHVYQTPSHAKEFFAKHSLREIYYLLYLNPQIASYELDVSVTAADQDPTTEIDMTLDLDYYDAQKTYHSDLHNELQEDLEEHSKALPGRHFFTFVAKGELVRKGTRERKAVGEFTYTHSCDDKLQKFTIFYDRTPYLATETDHTQFCVNAYLRYPDYDMTKLHDLDTLHLDQKVNALMNISYGKDCNHDHMMTIHGVLSRSKEQEELEAKRDVVDHHHYNPYAHYYHKCQEEHSRGEYYGLDCQKYIYHATRMNHYDIDIDIEQPISAEFTNGSRCFFNWLDHKLFYHREANYVVEDRTGKIEINLNFSPVHDTVDIEILKPHATVHYDDVPVQGVYKPVSASPYLGFTNRVRFNSKYAKSYCNVEGEYVRTYDNVTYHLPPIDCWIVLSKDCSDHENFLILGKSITHATYKKAVSVFLGKYKVEVLPVTEDSPLLVRVNGKKVEVTQDTSYFQHPADNPEKTIFLVDFNGLYYTITSPKYGVTVYYDGKAIVSQISPYYRGKQCGLCGDYNHEPEHEFRGPEDCVYEDVSDFAAAYSIRLDGCHAPEVSQSPCVDIHREH